MTRRCLRCQANLASDHDDDMCSPCERSRDEAVAHLARWLVPFVGRGSEVVAVIYADRLISLLSCGGADGERLRQRILRAGVPIGEVRRTTIGRIHRQRPVASARPQERREDT